MLPHASEVAGRQCFRSCVSVHKGGGGSSHHKGIQQSRPIIPPDMSKLVHYCWQAGCQYSTELSFCTFFFHLFVFCFYRPQMKLREGIMFSHVSVILSTWGGSAFSQCHEAGTPPPLSKANTPSVRQPPLLRRQTPPP